MEKIDIIFTCEDCNIVMHHKHVKSADFEKLTRQFKNKHKNCNPKFMSYFTISSIPLHEPVVS